MLSGMIYNPSILYLGGTYMTYNDFIALHPWVDLTLNLFETFAPVVVAIFAIFKNNSNSSKRDKLNKKLDMIANYENILIHKVTLTECAMDELLERFRNALQCTARDDVKHILYEYYSAENKVLKCCKELFNYSICASGILKENIDARAMEDNIQILVKSMHKMVNTHVYVNSFRKMEKEEEQNFKDIIETVNDVKAEMIKSVKDIMNESFAMLK
jgi:hypothetical protein